jgi:hypothetical protein
MAEPEDFHRDFLPRFIDAQRVFHDGDPEPNLALWSTEDPVTLFAARGLVDSGTEPVTETFRFVASTFSDVADLRLGDVGLWRGRRLRLHRCCRALYELQRGWSV